MSTGLRRVHTSTARLAMPRHRDPDAILLSIENARSLFPLSLGLAPLSLPHRAPDSNRPSRKEKPLRGHTPTRRRADRRT